MLFQPFSILCFITAYMLKVTSEKNHLVNQCKITYVFQYFVFGVLVYWFLFVNLTQSGVDSDGGRIQPLKNGR